MVISLVGLEDLLYLLRATKSRTRRNFKDTAPLTKTLEHDSRQSLPGGAHILYADEPAERSHQLARYRRARLHKCALRHALAAPALVAPLKDLRTWTFIFCFLSIGLTTRFKELVYAGVRPFAAFSIGVVVNVALGFSLSTVLFASYWQSLTR